jgi:hypothetical protein
MPVAFRCLAAIVSKKMDWGSKVSVMLQINVASALQQVALNPSFSEPYAPFVCAVSKESISCISKSMEDPSLNSAATAAYQILNAALPPLITTLQICSESAAEAALTLLNEFVALLKKAASLSDSDRAARPQVDSMQHLDCHLHMLLNAICSRLCLPLDFDFDHTVGDDTVDNGYRQELLTVCKNIARLKSHSFKVFSQSLLSTSIRDASNWSRCEVAVLLFFETGEVFAQDTIKAGEGDVASNMQLLLDSRVWDWPAPQLQSTIMETVLRYYRFFSAFPSYLPHVLAAFTDSRGIQSASEALRRRAAYLFMKLCKAISKHDPKKLASMISHICGAVLPVFETYLSLDAVKIPDHDARVQCAEALGIVIGSSNVPPDSKHFELSRFITPFTQLLAHVNSAVLHNISDLNASADSQKWLDRLTCLCEVISSVCKGNGLLFPSLIFRITHAVGLGRAAAELWPQLQAPVVYILQLISKVGDVCLCCGLFASSLTRPVQAPVTFFSAAMCFLPRIVDLGLVCLQAALPTLDNLLSTVTDCTRFIRVLSLLSQISYLYKGQAFPALVVLACSAQHRCQAVAGPPHTLPSKHASREHVISESQREAAEAYLSLMSLVGSIMTTAPAASFIEPNAASLVLNIVGIASAVAAHTCDVLCLKQSLLTVRRAVDHIAASPPLQASMMQVKATAAVAFLSHIHAFLAVS